MKTIIFLTLILLNLSIFSQKYVDMTHQLANIKGNLIIDGNILKKEYNTREEIIITGKNMKINHKSGFVFNNIIVQLTGSILVDDDSKICPKLLDSYIFCKYSEGISSKSIIKKSNFRNVSLDKVEYIKKINGNPEIWIYDRSGKLVYKGLKSNINNIYLSIARYDVKIKGKSFDEDILFY